MADRSRRHPQHEEVLVLGLGRFGGNLALELVELGHDVVGVDANPENVQQYAPLLTSTMAADTTRLEVLQQLGADQFHHVVVGIGDIEASILTVAELVSMGVTDVWAKAVTVAHKRILERVGAAHVVLPEHDMGKRIAHQVTGKIVDYIEFDDAFAMVETRVPMELWGKSLAEANLRARFDVTVVFIKPGGGEFTYATADSVLDESCIVLVAGDKRKVEAFAERT